MHMFLLVTFLERHANQTINILTHLGFSTERSQSTSSPYEYRQRDAMTEELPKKEQIHK